VRGGVGRIILVVVLAVIVLALIATSVLPPA
jgi:hypothetical protein